MKAINIKWDTDNDGINEPVFLPSEVEIPKGMNNLDEISDFLSELIGFCHDGFELVMSEEDGFEAVRSVQEKVADCFRECREEGDCYGIKVDEHHSLFILTENGKEGLEYLIELNLIDCDTDEPCAPYNASCPIDNEDKFLQTVMDYLSDNGISVE